MIFSFGKTVNGLYIFLQMPGSNPDKQEKVGWISVGASTNVAEGGCADGFTLLISK
jgi:hypothetical protein